MLTVSALSRRELGRRLGGPGIRLQTGAFVTEVRSAIPSVADAIGLLYADYPLLEKAEFSDFQLALTRPLGLRRWYHPQVNLVYDGQRAFRPLPLDHAFPMFEWGLNWCVTASANTYLIIHAAVVERDGHAAILPAPPGSGKSTLCAALVHRGWRLMSDELALIRLADGQLVSLPRPVSLKNASIELMRAYLEDSVFSAAVRDTQKGTVAHLKAPADSVARAAETARPGWIIFPRYEAGAAPVLTPMSRAQGFMGVAENGFNYSLVGERGFDALAGVIGRSDCFQFRYSQLDDAVDVFARLARPAL